MDIKIENGRGYYTMYVNGIFYGNYDSMRELNEDRDLLEEMEKIRQEGKDHERKIDMGLPH